VARTPSGSACTSNRSPPLATSTCASSSKVTLVKWMDSISWVTMVWSVLFANRSMTPALAVHW